MGDADTRGVMCTDTTRGEIMMILQNILFSIQQKLWEKIRIYKKHISDR